MAKQPNTQEHKSSERSTHATRNTPSVLVVYVTYNPDPITLKASIASIEKQVRKVILVDNGSKAAIKNFGGQHQVLHQSLNLGIGAAQNIGIRLAQETEFDYVLLSDQDTIYPENFVASLLPGFAAADNVAAVAPQFFDSRTKSKSGFVLNRRFRFTTRPVKNGWYEVRQAIASGSILSVRHLSHIGLMNESLFIDWVDIEWCWRANAAGYIVLGNADVLINHSLGDKGRNLGYRSVNLRSPQRHYYITRNAFHLSFRCRALRRDERAVLFLRSLRYLIAFPTLSPLKARQIKAVSLGLLHGMVGKVGRHDIV